MRDTVPELSFADYVGGEPHAAGAFSAALIHGLQRFGFIVLRDHPISAALIDRAYALSAQFFSQAEEIKLKFVRGARGYAPYRTEHAKNQTLPDLKEFWQIGPEPNVWPEWPGLFKATFLELYDALQQTGRMLLDALTPGLSLPAGFFEPLIHDRNSVLRLIHYPPLDEAAAGGVRSAAHEDVNLITLLLAPEGPGLELLDRDGRWLPLETSRNNLIVDSGDMLARMTNDLIPATTHRVVNPSGMNASRYSLPFFMHPDADVILRCFPGCVGAGARYPDIRAGTFLEQRLKEIGLVKADDPDSARR